MARLAAIEIEKIACEVCSSRTVDQTKLSCLILLPYCTCSHRWIQYIGDSHLKQTSDQATICWNHVCHHPPTFVLATGIFHHH